MKALVLITALAFLVCAASAATYSAYATGRVLCRIGYDLHPIKEVTVNLMDKDWLRDDLFGSTRSGIDGSFYTSGSVREFFGKPKPYIKVVYQYMGMYGQMEVNGLFDRVRNDKSRPKTYTDFIDFGDIVFSGDHCRAYVTFYNSLEDYFNRTSESFPVQPLHIRTQAIISFGEPYARTDTISIPRNYPVTLTTAKVQLGQILRHSLDGNAPLFNYGGRHECSTASNVQRAFDDGWGKYWAGGCTEYDYYFGSRDYRIVGHVAAGLRSLQMRCGFTDSQMIDVLRRNPRTIHSFTDYELASRSMCYNFPSPVPGTQSPPSSAPPPITTSTRRPPIGITGYRGVAQEDTKEEMKSEQVEMLQALMRLLENE